MTHELTRKEHIDVKGKLGLIVFEIHKDEKNRIYTSRFMIGRDRSRVQEVAKIMCDQLVKQYNFRGVHWGDLMVMSSDEADGIWVWVRSTVPIPPKRLGSGLQNPTPKMEANPFTPRLGQGDPDIIDI